MIRPLTCLCMLLAGASGLYLYQEKHSAQMLDREIAAIAHRTEAARERSSVLRAEWTLQNDPDRLARLAERFLKLKTIAPGQFTTMAELDRRLPAAGGAQPVAAAPPSEEQTQTISAAEPEPVTEAATARPDSLPARPDPKPELRDPKPEPRKEVVNPPPREVASPSPRPAEPAVKLAAATPRPAERRVVAIREPGPLPPPPPRRVASAEPRPPVSPPSAFAARPVVPAYSAAPQAMRPPMVTSVLGMARTALPPPVPYAPVSNGGGG